jgi:hypothetical protein
MPRPEPCPHPYAPKLTFVIAQEVRHMRRRGMAVKAIARKYGVAPASISAILKLHTYAPPNVVAVGLEPDRRAVLRDLAADDEISDELLAEDLIVSGMHRRIAREVGVAYEESLEPQHRPSRRV